MKQAFTAFAGAALIVVWAVSGEAAIAQDAKPDGKALFTTAGCNMCHAVPSQSIAAKATSDKMKGPDIAGITTDAAQLGKFLRKQADKNGTLHMKEFKGTDEELSTLVSWVLAQK